MQQLVNNEHLKIDSLVGLVFVGVLTGMAHDDFSPTRFLVGLALAEVIVIQVTRLGPTNRDVPVNQLQTFLPDCCQSFERCKIQLDLLRLLADGVNADESMVVHELLVVEIEVILGSCERHTLAHDGDVLIGIDNVVSSER